MKRAFDFTLALILLCVLSPVLLLLAACVRIGLGTPVLFRQQRPGLRGETFELIKFRTMSNRRDEHSHLLDDAARLSAFGRWLRRWSLDELPELLNVLRGDMSMVGPRPLLVSYLPLYSQHQSRRHDVRPGLTGWAQVNGRNALSWDERFELDVWYVQNHSFALDLKILWITVIRVFSGHGVSQEGHATMAPFTGSRASPAVGGVRSPHERAHG